MKKTTAKKRRKKYLKKEKQLVKKIKRRKKSEAWKITEWIKQNKQINKRRKLSSKKD